MEKYWSENEIIGMSRAWDKLKKKSESPTEFDPMASQTPGGRSVHSSYGELMDSEAIY